jgi:hypothetical protein
VQGTKVGRKWWWWQRRSSRSQVKIAEWDDLVDDDLRDVRIDQ